jgi:hypothetical protein
MQLVCSTLLLQVCNYYIVYRRPTHTICLQLYTRSFRTIFHHIFHHIDNCKLSEYFVSN